MKTALLVLCLSLMAARLEAQVVTAPTTASFSYTDAQLAQVTGFLIEDFQCASVTGGVCNGQAAMPFQTGATIPKANVTTLTPPDSFGNNRSMSLTTAPGSGILQSLPAGVPFVALPTAIGDPAQGLTNSPRGAASNPFFATAGPSVAPANLRAKP